MMQLIHIDHPNIPVGIRQAFEKKVTDIADWLGINPNWLMQVMYAESRMNAQAKNIQNGRLIAAGLLQWTKASGLPGAPKTVLQYNHLQQLDWVKKYFAPYRGAMHSYFDVYLVTFFPSAVGQGDGYVFATRKLPASLIAKQNPAINMVRDGKITMAEFKQYVWSSTPVAVRSLVFTTSQFVKALKDKTTKVITAVKEDPDNLGDTVAGIGTILAFFFLSAA
ncbi:hypothetical protein CAP35_01260 [Chitinophagaceae bacterium IBVUCB1]|nr:hypothetical protein CAP35_01260 [Chitinophagaceae bacterium IBVUCB1]